MHCSRWRCSPRDSWRSRSSCSSCSRSSPPSVDSHRAPCSALAMLVAERIDRTKLELALLPSAWIVVIAVLWMLMPLPIAPYVLPQATKALLGLALALACLSVTAFRRGEALVGIASCAAVTL